MNVPMFSPQLFIFCSNLHIMHGTGRWVTIPSQLASFKLRTGHSITISPSLLSVSSKQLCFPCVYSTCWRCEMWTVELWVHWIGFCGRWNGLDFRNRKICGDSSCFHLPAALQVSRHNSFWSGKFQPVIKCPPLHSSLWLETLINSPVYIFDTGVIPL